MMAWLGLVALLLAGLTAVQATDTVTSADDAINTALSWLHSRPALHVIRWVTRLGDSATLVAVVFVATGFLLAARHCAEALGLWVAFAGMQTCVWALKFWVAKPRPDLFPPLDVVLSPSFPSAHAAGALTVYGLVAWLLATRIPSAMSRFDLSFGAAVLIGSISLSRLILSVHTASDIAAGLLLGFFWLIVGMLVTASLDEVDGVARSG